MSQYLLSWRHAVSSLVIGGLCDMQCLSIPMNLSLLISFIYLFFLLFAGSSGLFSFFFDIRQI